MSVFKVCSILASFFILSTVQASLLINPTRVAFNPGDRSAEVTLINTTDQTSTYRLEWVEKKANAGGGYIELNDGVPINNAIASNMIRFSPRSVTLKPNERQTIKLALRRPASLLNNEYRSHLLFKAIPPAKQVDGVTDGQAMAINILLSFAIPVVVRQGELNYQLQPSSVELSYTPETKAPKVRFYYKKSGLHSVVGNIQAFWTPENSDEVLLAVTNEYSAWPEVSDNYLDLSWVGTDFALSSGKLRIVYEGIKEFKGTTFIDHSFNVNKEAITIIK